MTKMAYKYRLYPTPDQAKKIDHSINVCRMVYNLALETKIYAYKAHGKNITEFDLCYQLVDLKKEFPWIAEVDSQSLKAAITILDKSFKSFFTRGGFPKFKSKRNGRSFQCPNNTRKVNWSKNTLTIPKIKDIPIVLSRPFEGKIKTITIRKTTTGKYFASILVETEDKCVPKNEVNPEFAIGLDLGIKSFVVTSNGKSFESNSKLRNNLKRLQCLSKRASRKKKGSNNRKKANLCVSILHEKITNQRTDYIHKTTSELIKGDNQTFVIEDLNVIGMMKNRKLSRALLDVSFGEFFRQMNYKCEWYGKNLIQIGRFEPSSKMCSCCGQINKSITLADREWTCGCGVTHDRDLNAAINIRNIGLEKYSRRGTPGEPLELSAIVEAKKKELIELND